MATKITGTGVNLPTYATASRPGSPTQGQVIYNTTLQRMEIYDGGYWKVVTDSDRPFLYRTIITTGYVMGGYQNSSPWRNVNRMVHSTDVMTNLGDQIDYATAYTSGVNNLTKGFLWSADGSWPGTSAQTVAFNMSSETSAGINTANWNMRNDRNDCGTVFKETQYAYICGGGTGDIDCFNLTTEQMYDASMGADGPGGDSQQAGIATMSDEWAGYYYPGNSKIMFSTTVHYSITDTVVTNSGSQQKGINSKLGKGWGGNEGSYNGGNNLRRWSFPTETNLGTVAKPVTDSGEENFDMGQAWQYMYGCYTGAGQNNRGWKFNYSTESGVELGSGSVRTGVPGGSSGHCVWKG